MESGSHWQRNRATSTMKKGCYWWWWRCYFTGVCSFEWASRGTVYKYSREDSWPAITAEEFNQTNGFDSKPLYTESRKSMDMSWEQDGVVKRCWNPDSSNRQIKLSGALELCLLALKIGLKIADLMASYTAALFTSCDNDLIMMTCVCDNKF